MRRRPSADLGGTAHDLVDEVCLLTMPRTIPPSGGAGLDRGSPTPGEHGTVRIRKRVYGEALRRGADIVVMIHPIISITAAW